MNIAVNDLTFLDGQDPDFMGVRVQRVNDTVLAKTDFPQKICGALEGLTDVLGGSGEAVFGGGGNGTCDRGGNNGKTIPDIGMPQDSIGGCA